MLTFSAGFSPDVLHQAQLELRTSDSIGKGKERETDPALSPWLPVATSQDAVTGIPRVVYEINTDSDRLEPRLRVLVNSAEDISAPLLPLLQNLKVASESQTPNSPSTPEEDVQGITENAAVISEPGPSHIIGTGSNSVDETRSRPLGEEPAIELS